MPQLFRIFPKTTFWKQEITSVDLCRRISDKKQERPNPASEIRLVDKIPGNHIFVKQRKPPVRGSSFLILKIPSSLFSELLKSEPRHLFLKRLLHQRLEIFKYAPDNDHLKTDRNAENQPMRVK